MKYWLVKSEPNAWSWDEHVAAGIAEWDGVRSHQACNNMKAMKIGDRAFFYHSIKEKQVVGILEVSKEYYPDPTDKSERFGMVDFKALVGDASDNIAGVKGIGEKGAKALIERKVAGLRNPMVSAPCPPIEWPVIPCRSMSTGKCSAISAGSSRST